MFKAAKNLTDTLRLKFDSIAWLNVVAITAVILGVGGCAWTLHSAVLVEWVSDLLAYGVCIILAVKGSEYLTQKR